mgnify:FL=1
MKIVRRTELPTTDEKKPRLEPWKVLIVDDEPDVRRVTVLNLRGFQFAGRTLSFLEASSAAEAQVILQEHTDIALALVDVVMETDDAGLKLVEYIRDSLNYRMIRLIIRTGQPGVAPERYVIDNFDIDDYKDKSELTAQRLYTTVRTALKSYRDLLTIEASRIGLSRILNVTPDLYNLHRDRLEEYFQGVLMQTIGICNLDHSGLISTIDGLMLTLDGKDIHVRAGTGQFGGVGNARCSEIVNLCSKAVTGQEVPEEIRHGAVIVPLQVGQDILGFVYLESQSELSSSDRELIQVMANQCAAALDNFRLHHSLEDAYDESIDMLAQVAEFKDSATGTHIRRIQEYTRRVSIALGCSKEEADTFAKASDVGKVGIPDLILRKPGKLTAEEFTVMQKHTRIGDAVLKRSPRLAVARLVAKSHHEKWNGAGYPEGLKGDAIPLAARIVAVVDVFDALVSQRPYKESWPAQRAAAQIEIGSGSHFDPKIAQIFLSLYRGGDFDDLVTAAVDDAIREAAKDASA